MLVLKFGGSSVANATRMSGVLDIVESRAAEDRLILVSSAISGCTDTLLSGNMEAIAALRDSHQAIISRLFTSSDRKEAAEECDSLFRQIYSLPKTVEAYGEVLSTRILYRKLLLEGYDCAWIDSREIIIKDNPEQSRRNIAAAIAEHPEIRIFIAPGFIAGDGFGNTVTLGRGGSDYSAALYASGSGASKIEIWTDVPGIMTTNPKDCPNARSIKEMSYDAAFRMAELGAKVLYPPTVIPARESGIPIVVKDSFHPEHPGTVISSGSSRNPLIGLTRRDDTICLVSETPDCMEEARSRIALAFSRCRLEDADIREEGNAICVKIPQGLGLKALEELHKEFFEMDSANTKLLYIAGKGAVGTALRDLINSSGEMLRHKSGKTIRIVAQVDSSVPDFCEKVISEAPENSIFIDCTDSETIHRWYVPLLDAGINIVSSNRRSLSVPYKEYAAMKNSALRSGCFLRYETTVGAALPVLESIALSANSSDEITRIDAVVSCTLNYVLSSDLPYSEALQKAKEIGLTEKDPSQDLEGRDALRKLLILAREAGVSLDEQDVEIEPVRNLESIGENQRFVASLVKDDSSAIGYKASIRLQTVEASHPAYWLKGTDNVIIIQSACHSSPLVIEGAGEGARQAAASILNDILK